LIDQVGRAECQVAGESDLHNQRKPDGITDGDRLL
jgi:hypothetical protein